MIVWFNNKVTDNRRTPIGSRFGLANSDRFDVARYGFASFAVLDPLVSKFIFTLELADSHAGREREMEDWIRENFPEHKLIIKWSRCNSIPEWELMNSEIGQQLDDTIYLAGNEDYIFTDSTLSLWESALETIKIDPDPRAVFMMCHYPEWLRSGYINGSLHHDKNFSIHHETQSFAMQVIKLSHYYEFLEVNKPIAAKNERPIYMMDSFFKCPGVSKVYSPTKELCRHFDGYNHVGANPGVIPPISIPPGFFESNMVIRYGFDERDPNCVNINPLKQLVTVDKFGTDYKMCLEDIPLFWKSRIKEIIIAKNIDHHAMKRARNIHYLNMGKAMDSRIPDTWFQNHLI